MVDDGKNSHAFRLLKIALGCLLHDSPDKGSLCGFAHLRGLFERVQISSWQDCSIRGSLSKEDAAFICVEVLNAVPEKGFIFEVC